MAAIPPGNYRTEELALFFRQFGVLLRSGIPLQEALNTLDSPNLKGWRNLARDCLEEIQRGGMISTAIERYEARTGPLAVAFMRSGEQIGNLDEMALTAAELFERRIQIRRGLSRELFYPALVITVGILVTPLPQLVRFGFSAYLSRILPPVLVISLIIGAIVLVRRLLAQSTVRESVDALILSIPVLRVIIGYGAITRLCQTLAIGYRAGLPVTEVVPLAARAAGNARIGGVFSRTFEAHQYEEHGLSRAIGAIHIMPPMVTQMCQTGERTGNLDEMLMRVADFIEQENLHRRQRAIQILGFLALAGVGLWVGYQVVSFWTGFYQNLPL